MPLLVALAASKLQSRTGAARSGCLRLCPGRRRGEARPRADGGRAGLLPPARLQVGAVEGPPPARGWSRLLPRLPLPGSHLRGNGKRHGRAPLSPLGKRLPPPPPPSSPPGGREAPRARGEVHSSPSPPVPADRGSEEPLPLPGPAPPDPAAGLGGRLPHPLLEAFVRPPHPGSSWGAASPPRPALPRAECAPRRRPGPAAVSGRCGAAGVGAAAPASPRSTSPSPFRLPPWAGAPGALKRNLTELPVLSPGRPEAHLARPGGESLGPARRSRGRQEPRARLRVRVLPGNPRPPQRLSQRRTSEIKSLLWSRLDNIAGAPIPVDTRHPSICLIK